MLTFKSKKREISDLQRLLLTLGLIEYTDKSTDGVWGPATQAGVVRLYDRLGWDHPTSGRWVTAPALAAITGLLHRHEHGAEKTDTGGGGSYTGGGGSYTGGGGSYTGGGGSYTGGGGSYTGGGSTPE